MYNFLQNKYRLQDFVRKANYALLINTTFN